MKYDIIIGLEIHAELKTDSKMFCSCLNIRENVLPNTNVCPICLGHPGTLPMPNKKAIDLTILTGLALNCQINLQSKFDRKNYYFPDLPKGYQISQYDKPFAYQGHLIVNSKKIDITRIHLEEDTGKSFHQTDKEQTLIDFNRAGAPLLELVTDPMIKDALEAKAFCQEFQKVLRYLEVSSANMESGEMRCEANISLQKPKNWRRKGSEIIATGKNKLNNKVEVKNINSFKSLEKAINFEIARQTQLLDKKQEITAETRGYDEKSNKTVSQRKKEAAADYRYFKEPDIPDIILKPDEIEKLRKQIGELPIEKKKRFKKEYGLKEETIDILISDKDLANFTEKMISELAAWTIAEEDNFDRQSKKLSQMAANWLSGELLTRFKNDNKRFKDNIITAENFAELMSLIWRGKVNSNTGLKILEIMYNKGGDPTNIMDDLGLEQIDNSDKLVNIINDIVNKFPKQVQMYKDGKTPVIKFLIGQVMAHSKGRANPQKVQEILEKMLIN
jgi:aspartyl-tRNA(Asn)/glutamyl-tRNA(Gln) amidotransferase subunit B